MKLRYFVAGPAVAALLAGTAFAGGLTNGEVRRTAPSTLLVSWSASGPVDVYLADRADASIAQARLISNDDGDGFHSLTSTGHTRSYVLLKEDGGQAITRLAERLVPLERGSNFRDIGGYRGADGRHVRWGMIYRTGAPAMLTEQDYRTLARLNIATQVDLRSVEERRLAPSHLAARTGARYFAHDYSMAAQFAQLGAAKAELAGGATMRNIYRDMPTALAPQYRAMFEALLERKGALAYNCSAGQDRTGVATALVLSALGVPRHIILADYHLSSAYRRPQFEMPAIDPASHPGDPVALFFAKAQQSSGGRMPRPLYNAAGVPHLSHAFDEIDTRWGSIENYLDQVLGVDTAELALLRATYLER